MNKSEQPDTLKNKIILITGASDGIGKAAAIECAKQGATVILVGKTQKKLELVYDEIENHGYPEALIHPMDFEKATAGDFQNLHDSLYAEFGHLDGLINNAAWLGASTPVEHYDIELWYRVMQINLNAPFMLTKACLPLLSKAKKASIVFTLDDKNDAYWGAYGVSKGGLKSLMEITAAENDDSTISVTGFNPGAISSNLRIRAYPAEDNKQLKKPETISQHFAYLISGDENIPNGKVFTMEDFN